MLMMPSQDKPFKTRHPVLVFFWFLGILLLYQFVQAVGFFSAYRLFNEGDTTAGESLFADPHSILFFAIYSLFIALPLVLIFARFLWARTSHWMRLTVNIKLLLSGFLVGIGFPVIITGIMALSGLISVIAGPGRLTLEEIVISIPGYLIIMLYIGISEEVLIRGMLAREWAARFGWPAATLLSGILFGILHVFNADVSDMFTAINLVIFGIIFNIFFTSLYVRAQSLWLPIGFHTGWNFCLIAILGTPLSGIGSVFSLFKMRIAGPIWLSGGTFGIEHSVISYGFTITASLFFLKFPFTRKINLLESYPSDNGNAICQK